MNLYDINGSFPVVRLLAVEACLVSGYGDKTELVGSVYAFN